MVCKQRKKNATIFVEIKEHAPTAIDYRKIFYSSFTLQNLMIFFSALFNYVQHKISFYNEERIFHW